MVLSAFPAPASELRTLFLGTNDSIRRRLEKPPTLRYAGFDLETGDQAQNIGGEKLRVANGDRKILELYRDGTLLFVCRADDWFLAWASPSGEQRLNPLALIESIYSFTDFYRYVIGDLRTAPTDIHFRVDLRNLHERGVKTTLAPHAVDSGAQMFGIDLHEAPDDTKTIAKSFPATYVPAIAAYELVREIYIWFGVYENDIPYVKTEGDVHMIDVAFIRNIKP